jgi:hypothetical protein
MTPPGAHSFTNHRWNHVGLVQNDSMDRARGEKVPPLGVCEGGGADEADGDARCHSHKRGVWNVVGRRKQPVGPRTRQGSAMP